MVLVENPVRFTDRNGSVGLRFTVRVLDDDTGNPLLVVNGVKVAWGRLEGPSVGVKRGPRTVYSSLATFHGRLLDDVLAAVATAGWRTVFRDVAWPKEAGHDVG